MKVIFSSLAKDREQGSWREFAVHVEEALEEAEIDFSVIRPPNPSAISTCDILYEGTYTSQWTLENQIALRSRVPDAVFVLQLLSAHPNVYSSIYYNELQKYGLRDDRFPPSWYDTLNAAITTADAVFCYSEWMRKSLIENQVEESKIRVTPLGVDVNFWRPESQSKGKFRVGFAGQLQLIKGLQYLFEAWKELDYGSLAELLVVGSKPGYIMDGRKFWACEKVFAHYLELPNVIYKGHFNRVSLRSFYSSLDVLVAPSLEDGWCMVAVEAMACGTPVVVTTATGMAQIIEDGVNGFVVPPRAPDALAERLEWFRAHPDAAIEMGAAARETVLCYDVPTYKGHFIRALADIYTDGRE